MRSQSVRLGIYILSLLMIFFIFTLTKKNAYDEEVKNIFNLENRYTEISIPELVTENTDFQELNDIFNSLSDKYNTSIVGRVSNYSSIPIDPGTVDPVFKRSDVTFYVLDKDILTPSIHIDENYPSYFDHYFLTQVQFEIKSLKELASRDYKVTTFFIENSSNIDQVILELATRMNEKFQVQLTSEDLLDIGIVEDIILSDNGDATFTMVAIILFIFIFSLIFLTGELSEVAIYKLHGLSLTRILFKLFFINYLLIVLSWGAFMSSVLFGELRFKLLALIIIYVVVLFLFIYFFAWIFTYRSFSDLLNNKSFSTSSMWLVYCIKLLTLLVASTAIVLYTPTIEAYFSQKLYLREVKTMLSFTLYMSVNKVKFFPQ